MSPEDRKKESPTDTCTITRVNLKNVILRKRSRTDVTGYKLYGSTDTKCPEQAIYKAAQWLRACPRWGVQVEVAVEQGGNFLGC